MGLNVSGGDYGGGPESWVSPVQENANRQRHVIWSGVANHGDTDEGGIPMSAASHHGRADPPMHPKQWPSSQLIEKKAYHRIALDRLTLG